MVAVPKSSSMRSCRMKCVALSALALLLSCGGDDGPPRACDSAAQDAHTCSELTQGEPSLDCAARGGEPVARCEADAPVQCEADTSDGVYRVFGYDGVDQAAVDARCEELRQRVEAHHAAESANCSWSIEGDEASGMDKLSGPCELSSFTENSISFRDLGLNRAASLTKLDFGFFISRLPQTLSNEHSNFTQFTLSMIGRVQEGEVTPNWYCSWINNGRSEPRGTFRVELERFILRDQGKSVDYKGSLQAECPAAGPPAQGSLKIRVEFANE